MQPSFCIRHQNCYQCAQKQTLQYSLQRRLLSSRQRALQGGFRQRLLLRSHKVCIEYEGGTAELDVPEGSTILEAALDKGLELKHDCKMGVCMTCPGKVISGEVDQSAGMLDEGAREKGYALLCVSQPLTDCKVATITEEEILDEVLCA